jgi:hypothetical protein
VPAPIPIPAAAPEESPLPLEVAAAVDEEVGLVVEVIEDVIDVVDVVDVTPVGEAVAAIEDVETAINEVGEKPALGIWKSAWSEAGSGAEKTTSDGSLQLTGPNSPTVALLQHAQSPLSASQTISVGSVFSAMVSLKVRRVLGLSRVAHHTMVCKLDHCSWDRCNLLHDIH